MHPDPITDEIRAIRRALAAEFGNDVRKIVAETQRLESTDDRRYQTLPRRPLRQDRSNMVKPVDLYEPEANT